MSRRPGEKLPSRAEAEKWAKTLAHNARLDNPLSEGTDYSAEEMEGVQAQINALTPLPPRLKDPLFMAFAAKYLPAVASSLRFLTLETQKNAFSTLVQIMSLLPDPEKEPYFRRFLLSPQCEGIPNLVASSFITGITWLRSSGPGYVANLIHYMLLWCATDMGDDKEGAIDKGVREAVLTQLEDMKADESYSRLEPIQRAQIQRLFKMLMTMRVGPPAGLMGKAYIEALRGLSEGQIRGQEECVVCDEDELQLFLCSKCKTIKYCSKECQASDWKAGHKIKCYATEY
ncbi:hypothetical protein PHLGIDRAFT_405139 [Phlebiopsis gigantea 11061_1 CR5-6]|uniref:MYND-type domain-containing protein n=1 Tax=Phlebiopsis gigantea (strain 11061_1 CR5-6) TaxID=745531 RepID=A0A0C3SBE2_PHLG1|nr:hypothetical protein PHLGIDRAFT_405139 [Phlebiopsis gigantea 11061_1 CR5-6]